MLYTIQKFDGLNESVDRTLLETEASKIINADIRKGVLNYTKAPKKIEDSFLDGIHTLMRYSTDKAHYLLASTNDSIYKWSNNSWSKIIGNKKSAIYDYINNNVDSKDIIVWSNGLDNIEKYDGTEVKELKMKGASSDYSDTKNRAPKGAFLALHYERLWIANDNYLYCSSVTANGGFDLEDFTTPTEPEWEVNNHGAEIFMYSNDGTKIKGLAVVYDDIIIFKERKVFRLWGTTPSQMQKVELFNATGAIADKTITSTPQGCFFVHRDGIYLYDGSNVSKVSQKIQDTWDTINQDYIEHAVGYFWDNKYILAVSTREDGEKDLIIELDTLTSQFVIRTGYNVRSFVEFNNKLIFSSSDGYVYEYNEGNREPLEWESAEITIPDGVVEVESVRVHTVGTGRIEVSIVTEKKVKKKELDIVKDGVKLISLNNAGRGAVIRIKVLTGDVVIRKVYLEYDVDVD